MVNICKKCGEEKEMNLLNIKDKIYFSKICQDCFREKEKERSRLFRLNNKESRFLTNRKYSENNKEAIAKRKKSYRINNKEILKEKWTEYNLKNKEIKKEYYLNNKEEIRLKKKIYNKNRLKNDQLYKLRNGISSLIRASIKSKGFVKKTKASEILGCSIEEFKIYLETKFQPWMNWDNKGLYNGNYNYGWDIDHMIPSSIAKSEEEIIKLNHFSNLQPLCSKTNRYIKKNNSII